MLPLRWGRREPPLPPAAVLATGAAVPGLAAATAAAVRLGRDLRVLRADDALLVLGRPDDLPWAPEVTYLGWVGPVLLPTTADPGVPTDLLRAAVRAADVTVVTDRLLLTGRRPARPPDPESLR